MEAVRVKEFLNKIKVYYPNMDISNEYVLREWTEELKPYDEEDVMKKFDEHLRGEYNNTIPKLHYFTKFLLTSEQKHTNMANYEILRCNICNKKVKRVEFNQHIERCNSVEYLDSLSKKLNGNGIDKELLRSMNKDKFLKFYWRCLNNAYDRLNDGLEKRILGNTIKSHNGESLNFTTHELIRGVFNNG